MCPNVKPRKDVMTGKCFIAIACCSWWRSSTAIQLKAHRSACKTLFHSMSSHVHMSNTGTKAMPFNLHLCLSCCWWSAWHFKVCTANMCSSWCSLQRWERHALPIDDLVPTLLCASEAPLSKLPSSSWIWRMSGQEKLATTPTWIHGQVHFSGGRLLMSVNQATTPKGVAY